MPGCYVGTKRCICKHMCMISTISAGLVPMFMQVN